MNNFAVLPRVKRFRFPRAIISYAVWAYHRFNLSNADGDVLDILVQARRNTKAAKRFLCRLVKKLGEPRVVVTDKLRSNIKPIQCLAPDTNSRPSVIAMQGLMLSACGLIIPKK